jgi:hypothetical protein
MASGKKQKGNVPAAIVLVALASGIGFAIFDAVSRDTDVGEHAERFLSALRNGDWDKAYSELSQRRRTVMSREQFVGLANHPALVTHTDAWFEPAESHGEGLCTLGGLNVDGDEWGVQLYYVEEGDEYAIHSFAIQPPATMQLGTLLPECGYWEGTTMGYSGPPIALTTRPTD